MARAFKIKTKTIDTSKMGVEKYNRPLEKQTLAYLKSNHNDLLVNPPTLIDVSKEDLPFDYAMVNGNHTTTHLKRLGYEAIDCRIIPYQPYQMRARTFRELNDGSKVLTAEDKFVAKLEEEEPTAMEIYKTCSNLGLGFSKIDKLTKKRKAFVNVAWINQLEKWNVLSEVLETCMSAWGYKTHVVQKKPNMWVVTDYMARSIGKLIKLQKGDIDLSILAEQLSKEDPREVHEKCFAWRGKGNKGYIDIAMIYNKAFHGRDRRKSGLLKR